MASTLSGALIIAILISLLKPFLEQRFPQGSPLHDATIRFVAVLLGVGGSLADQAIGARLTAPLAWAAAQSGLLAAVTAIASFHLVTRSYFVEASAATLLAPPVTITTPVHTAGLVATAPVAPAAGYSAATLEPGILPPAV